MSKITKNERIKELERQVKGLTVLFSSLNTWSEYADSMLTELNHALPDPEYDAECEADEPAINASLDRHRERLGLNKPQLKQLDQSVFDGLDDDIICAVVKSNGEGMAANKAPFLTLGGEFWGTNMSARLVHLGGGYDASNWQNSLIERDIAKELLEVDLSSELTGNDLTRAMLARGDKIVLCVVGDYEHEEVTYYDAITHCSGKFFESSQNSWNHATPINNQGEPLTASEVGL